MGNYEYFLHIPPSEEFLPIDIEGVKKLYGKKVADDLVEFSKTVESFDNFQPRGPNEWDSILINDLDYKPPNGRYLSGREWYDEFEKIVNKYMPFKDKKVNDLLTKAKQIAGIE